MVKLRISTLIGVCLALAVFPAAAAAKAPPTGKYECTIGSTLFGDLRIKSGNKYTHRGTKGTFTHGKKKITFSDGKKGWKISFKKGSLSGMKGRWYRSTSDPNIYEIALKNPKDDFESIYCDKWK